jgi:hypothetical protein
MVTADAVLRLWVVTLVLYAVVLGVVAALLALVLGTARRIRAALAEVWTVGQQVANNTVHIARLDPVGHVVGEIAAAAPALVRAVAALRTHAERCAGCPACLGRS